MKLWVGSSPPKSSTGINIKDNGLCALDESGIKFAASAERYSRIKHDNEIDALLNKVVKSIRENIVSIGLSSCTDTPWEPKKCPWLDENVAKYLLPSHHYSHALSTYYTAAPGDWLILSSDAGGNTFAAPIGDQWWTVPREQTCLWYGTDGDVFLLEREHFEPLTIGFGEWYRAFTYYLGWHSHTHSGNTMALAAFGSAESISEGNLWDIADFLKIKNEPRKPLEMVRSVLKGVNRADIQPRKNGDPITEDHQNLAAFVQKSLEVMIIRIVEKAIATYGCRSIALTGGVAQNCVMAARVASRNSVTQCYVSPFSSDVGQCIGNAIYAFKCDNRGEGPQMEHEPLPFWGKQYTKEDVVAELAKYDYNYYECGQPEMIELVGRAINSDRIVALFAGRSEFGPRALGHRSVLGDATSPDVVDKIRKGVKGREPFMPLAPMINTGLAARLGTPKSKTMVFAPEIPQALRKLFAGALHVDNTARLQIVDDNSLSGRILEFLYNTTGKEVIINTSFNGRGEPIVESPKDALDTFSRLPIDCLSIEGIWIEKPNRT